MNWDYWNTVLRFNRCGVSEGKYVFLGYFEQYDIDDVLEHALDRFKFIDPERFS